jgi:hypothetical protein
MSPLRVWLQPNPSQVCITAANESASPAWDRYHDYIPGERSGSPFPSL